AAFTPDAKGRHLTAGEVVTLPEMGRMLKEDFAKYPLPTRQLPKWLFTLLAPVFGLSRENARRNVGVSIKIDNSKSKSLGVAYRPIKETLVDHMQQMLAADLIPKK
ncbi:MAG: diaminohydroxyphosphoribosylaminopyrimidine deaminase, partial [Bacteroidota bacterium]